MLHYIYVRAVEKICLKKALIDFLSDMEVLKFDKL